MQKINELLHLDESMLGKLVKQATSACLMNDALQQIMTQDCPPCQVGSFIKGVLILTTENAADATRLRYHVPTLLSQLRQFPDWAGLCTIKIKVKPTMPERVVVHEKAYQPTMSDENRTQLRLLAEALKTKDPANAALAKTLERIAKLFEGGQ